MERIAIAGISLHAAQYVLETVLLELGETQFQLVRATRAEGRTDDALRLYREALPRAWQA